MKVELKMVTEITKTEAVIFKKGPSGRRAGLIFPPLPPSVNPLFRMAHHAQFHFAGPSVSGGQK